MEAKFGRLCDIVFVVANTPWDLLFLGQFKIQVQFTLHLSVLRRRRSSHRQRNLVQLLIKPPCTRPKVKLISLTHSKRTHCSPKPPRVNWLKPLRHRRLNHLHPILRSILHFMQRTRSSHRRSLPLVSIRRPLLPPPISRTSPHPSPQKPKHTKQVNDRQSSEVKTQPLQERSNPKRMHLTRTQPTRAGK